MADPLVQNQQPLTQAADQQPVYQRGIDPRKLQSFIMQEHYKTKIKTILDDDTSEAAEIFAMEGLNWEEKLAEAKTRTTPLVDEMDQVLLNPTSTMDDLHKIKLANPFMSYKERTAYRQIESDLSSRITTAEKSRIASEKVKRGLKKEFLTEKEQEYNLNIANKENLRQGFNTIENVMEDVLRRSKFSSDRIKSGILTEKEKTEKMFDMGDEEWLEFLKKRKTSIAEYERDYKIIKDELNKDLGTNEEGKDIGKFNVGNNSLVNQALWGISKHLVFPKGTGYTDAGGNFIKWDFKVDHPEIAQSKWVAHTLKKIEDARKSLGKIKEFQPTMPELAEAQEQQQQQPQGETWENVAPHIQQAENPEGKKYNTNDGTLTGTPINTNGTIDVGKYQVNSKWIVQKGENFAYNQQGEKDSLWWDIQDAIKQDVPTWDTMPDDQRMETIATNDSLNTKVSKMIFDARGLEQWSTADTVRQAIGGAADKPKISIPWVK